MGICTFAWGVIEAGVEGMSDHLVCGWLDRCHNITALVAVEALAPQLLR
jgi:hypothetical protein